MRMSTEVWIRKRKGIGAVTYGLRWIDPGTGSWKSESCGHDLALARLRRDVIRGELRQGLSGRLPETTLPELAERLAVLMAGKAASTIARTADTLRLLDRLCGPRLIVNVNRAVVMDFKAKRLAAGMSPATVNKATREIRSALSYAENAGLVRTNLLLRWKGLLLRVPDKVVRVVEEAEFAALVKATEIPGLQALLTVGYRQGLRRTELVNLRWSALDLERGVMSVVNRPDDGELTKSRKNRTIPIHPDVLALLRGVLGELPMIVSGGQAVPKFPFVFCWPDGQPFKADWITRAFGALVTKAGIPHATIHDLRRSFSTLAQRAGVGLEAVRDLGGWSTTGVVEKHYTGQVPERLTAAMAKIVAAAG